MSSERTIKSGSPADHTAPVSNVNAGGASAGLPSGLPERVQAKILATSSSLKDGSSFYS
jgi:hypothetical protein